MTDELKIPPPCFVFMEGDILEVTDTSMRVKFPVKPEYQNPFGYMQGGFLVAAMDNTIGPLSFIVADPSVTIQLNTSFIRPVTPQTDYIIVEAWLKEKTRKLLFLEAKVTNAEGKMLCMAQASQTIL